jgi:hypothetical protein
MYSNMLTE